MVQLVTNLPLPYIRWKEFPGVSKPRKVPVDQTGHPIDPHDPANHLPAPAPEFHPGVVLSDNDPYFLLDLDGCRDPSTGEWTKDALHIASLFPGAAMEVSFNGTGLHIMGRCGDIGPRKHKFSGWLEFYQTGRFVALGHGLVGNIDLDWTEVLSRLVPVAEVDNSILTGERDPAWSGPEDDDELIRIMLSTRPSAAQAFGDRATVADLWNANVEVLAKVFPSPSGSDFDHSSADQALLNHLAFWTGKDGPRMDRLFRKSGLMREKYEKRADYRRESINSAISGTRNVFVSSRSQEQVTSEFITLAQLPEYFKDCVYVEMDERILIPGGRLLKQSQFRVVYGGHQFAMAYGGEKPTYNAWEAFTENRAIKFPKVVRTRFLPSEVPGAIIGDGVNIYWPDNIPTSRGDVTPFLNHLHLLLPVERDRQILLAFMASLVQNPGKKFLWAPVLQGTKGNGKSLIAEVLCYCIGDTYSWTPESESITKQFNPFLQNRMLINVEEIHMFERFDMLEKLKNYITATKVEIEKKGVDAGMNRDYCANWFFCTNHKDAIIKEKDDRRFAIFFTAQQTREDMIRDGMLKDNYFPRLWDWLRREGFSRLRGYLLDYAIPDELNPATSCIVAPDTSSTGDAIMASYGTAEQYIIDAIEQELPGFRGGWLSSWAVEKLLLDRGIKRAPQKIAAILTKMGYIKEGRYSSLILQEGNSRPTIYKLPGTTIPYGVAQGYDAVRLARV